MAKRRILHIIPSLEQGGAERILTSFVTNDEASEHIVVKLFASNGLFEAELRLAGIRLVELGIVRSPLALLLVPVAIIRLLLVLIGIRPTVVVGWLYYGALASVFAWLVRVPVVWSIHASDFDLQTSYRPLTRAAIRLCRKVSTRVPGYIQYCSFESMEHHIALGFPSTKSGVVENAVPLATEPPDTHETMLSLTDENEGRIACIARFEAQKDHNNLFAAAAILQSRGRAFKLLLAGAGCSSDNDVLKDMIGRHDLDRKVECLGVVSDVPALIVSSHCTTLASSDGEAMPMVLLESIAHGRPVVATDVGSSGRIVDRFGLIVAPKDPEALADALDRVVWQTDQFSEAAATNGWTYVNERFSISRFVERWHKIFDTLDI